MSPIKKFTLVTIINLWLWYLILRFFVSRFLSTF